MPISIGLKKWWVQQFLTAPVHRYWVDILQVCVQLYNNCNTILFLNHQNIYVAWYSNWWQQSKKRIKCVKKHITHSHMMFSNLPSWGMKLSAVEKKLQCPWKMSRVWVMRVSGKTVTHLWRSGIVSQPGNQYPLPDQKLLPWQLLQTEFCKVKLPACIISAYFIINNLYKTEYIFTDRLLHRFVFGLGWLHAN